MVVGKAPDIGTRSIAVNVSAARARSHSPPTTRGLGTEPRARCADTAVDADPCLGPNVSSSPYPQPHLASMEGEHAREGAAAHATPLSGDAGDVTDKGLGGKFT